MPVLPGVCAYNLPHVYCPHCGVNNDRGETECYICAKPLPAMDAPAAIAPGRPQARKAAVVAERPGTPGDRALAFLFDRVFLAALLGAGAASVWTGPLTLSTPATQSVAMGAAAVLLVPFAYHVILESLFKTTVGKAMMGLQIRTLPGRTLVTAMLLRNLLRILDSIAFYLVGFLVAMFTQQHQRIGDLVGHTVVMERQVANVYRALMMVFWLAVVLGAGWWMYSTNAAIFTRR